MKSSLRWQMTAAWAAVGLAALGLTCGCGGGSSGPDDGDDNATVISPAVVLADAGGYEVESAWIGRSSSTSDYVYGVVKIKYLGATDQAFVEVEATFKDKKGRTIFEDETYVRNPGLCSIAGVGNTNTFLTADEDTGYYLIIEDLSTSEAQLGDIARVELSIAADTYECLPPVGRLSVQGGPAQVPPDGWRLSVRNDGTVPVDEDMSRFIFADQQGRIYKWTFPDCYVGGTEGTRFAVGDTGTLEAEEVTPDFVEDPLDFAVALVGWESVAAGKRPSPLTAAWSQLSVDERAQALLEETDRLEAARKPTR